MYTKEEEYSAHYIAMRPILDLCKKTVQIPGVGLEKVVGGGGTVPGGRVESDGGIRRGGGAK